MRDVFLGAIGFGAIGFLFAKPFTDIFGEKMIGFAIGFVLGVVIMVVVKASGRKKGELGNEKQ